MSESRRHDPNRKLLFSVTIKDCDVQTFQAGGKGGQHQNKTSSAVRIIHRASGARGESRQERSQLQNKKNAWRRMVATPQFRVWLAREWWVRVGLPDPAIAVERDMAPQNIRAERRVNGKWTPWKEEE